MQTILLILALIAIVILAALFCKSIFLAARESVANGYFHSPHETGMIARVAEANFAVEFLLASSGASGAMALCGATDRPLGPCVDKPNTGERGTIAHLGATCGTKAMIASKVIAADVPVYTTAGGKVTDTAVNNSWLVGYSAEAGTVDKPLEVIPCSPVKQTV